MIDFEVDDREFHATFLPEVASEEGWDQKTTLRYLVRKAGCYMFDDELLNSIQCTRYQTEKAYLLFKDYVKMTQERNRDAAEFLKSRGIELKWIVCWNHWFVGNDRAAGGILSYCRGVCEYEFMAA